MTLQVQRVRAIMCNPTAWGWAMRLATPSSISTPGQNTGRAVAYEDVT